MSTRIVFMGSPDFAVPSLRALNDKFSLAGVVTQPDRPAGRGRKLKSPPVKILAEELGLPVIQPVSLRKEPAAVEQIRGWNPDVIVVVAYGQILRQEVLELPPHGCVNVHASLLPRWRGAAPINAAILNGDTQTGVTIMQLDAGMDTGPTLSQRAIPISTEVTAGELSEKLSTLGAEVLLETLPKYLNGEIAPQPQDDSNATYAPMLKKADGQLDFNLPAEVLARKVRAFHPWPGTSTDWAGGRLKIHSAYGLPPEPAADPVLPGETTIHQGLPAIGTAYGLLVLETVQPAGKKAMPGAAFLAGARDWA